MEQTTSITFTPYQKLVIAVLAFLQFTVILDFMVMSPLGAMLMPALKITPSQFGLAVSVYAFSAGISGFLAAGFADRYDRKKLLLFFYIGFVFATLMCGIAWNYHFLIFARTLTGIFGGVIGSIVMAVVTDLFPFQARGRVMGYIQTAFASSQILGLPIALFLANHWGWHAPFMMIVVVAGFVGFLIFKYLQPIDEHLKMQKDTSPIRHLTATLSTPRYLLAFVAMALLSVGGFMLMPFSSAFTVHNLAVPIENLPMIYLVTGISAIFMGPLVGRISDRAGKFPTFLGGTVITALIVLYYTRLGPTPLTQVILINVILFSGIFSRMIPAQAMASAIPSPESRGAFMSVSSSLQQVSGGIASVIAGMIVVQGAGGALQHFDRIGYTMLGTLIVTAVLMFFVNKMVSNS
jgi:predicted MFS family arabinose efflux permease